MQDNNGKRLNISHRLIQLGFILFLVGLFTGFAVPAFALPRMGLASHIQGIINGMFLILLGAIWDRLALSRRAAMVTLFLVIYGTFANWLATLLAAIWGASRSMPIAASGRTGIGWQDVVVDLLLFSLSFAMIVVTILVLWGLRLSGPGEVASEQS